MSAESLIRLFISDIDGCIAEPYHPYDLRGLNELAALIDANRDTPFSLCSGRAYPYVEAVTQILGLRAPVLFESGGGMFDPIAARIEWNPRLVPEIEGVLKDVRSWLLSDLLPGTTMMYDYGKRTQAGCIGPDSDEVYRLVEVVESYVQANHPGFRVFHTDVSIDVVYEEITKSQAIEWMADRLDLDVSEIAFIGDTNGDIDGLRLVGRSFSPANGTDAVKQAVQSVSAHRVVDAVIEAYNTCLIENRSIDGRVPAGT